MTSAPALAPPALSPRLAAVWRRRCRRCSTPWPWCGPLLPGRLAQHAAPHLAVLAAYAIVAFYAALVLTRRRLLT